VGSGQLLYSAKQECRDVSRALSYGHDFYELLLSAVDDQLSSHRPEKDWVVCEVLSLMPDPRVAG
jgi:hypothetical protein